ncbi:initiator Replication protein [Salmonella enterica]|uniref:replication initiation protein n=1 Tax=Salmonella enterica TaxID=28901 RepID=UPI00076B9B36|nr:replication initiation protein [Salmonella enterica]GAR00361.1 initiator Replication protein [Salmonella enterica]
MSVSITNKEKREDGRGGQDRAQVVYSESKDESTFPDESMPYLTQLKGQSTRVVVKNATNLSRTNSISIYEPLQQFPRTGDRTIVTEDLRAMLGSAG